jgi:hypothetical protein
MALSKIHQREKPALGPALAALLGKQYAGDALLGPYVTALPEASAALQAALEPRTSAPAEAVAATGAATELDGIRDDGSRALYYLLLAWSLQRQDPALAAVARELLARLFPHQLALVDFPLARQTAATETLLATAAGADVAAKLGQVPGASTLVTALSAAQANFAAAVAVRPALKGAVTAAVAQVAEAEDAWDGVLYGYLGAVRRRFPGAKGKPAREALLAPLREVAAREKSRGTRRQAAKKPPAPQP